MVGVQPYESRMRPTLLALLLLVTASCTPSSGASITDEPSQPWPSLTGQAAPSDTSTYIAGLDVAGTDTWLTEGWFTTGHSHAGLFKSADAGSAWTQVLGWDGWPRWQRHFSASTAIVAAEFEEPGYLLHTRLLSTNDGGDTWRARNLPVTDDAAIRSIYFSDPSNGWLMLSLEWSGSVACGQTKEGIAIYRTRDGGASWSEILRVDEQHPDAGGISIDGAKDGLSFASPMRGYITTSNLEHGNVAYATSDGGANWTRVLLPFDQSPGVAYTGAPTWLDASAGLISVSIGPQRLMQCSVQRSPSATPPPPSPGPWSVEAPSFLVAPYPGSLLFHTVDGGASWSEIGEDSKWGDISSISSLDDTHWAAVNIDTLWLTADAGSTWQVNNRALDPSCSFALVRFVDQKAGLASAFCGLTPGVIQGCEHTAEYKSDWDCPPVGTRMLATDDGGRTWTATAKPDLQ